MLLGATLVLAPMVVRAEPENEPAKAEPVKAEPVKSEPVKAEPVRVVPKRKRGKERRAERRAKDWSEGGQRRGILELTLGSITAGVAVLLVARGGWELHQAAVLRESCDEGSLDVACQLDNPTSGSKIAAGLSFAFAVPVGIASGFLFARGARTHRDYKSWKATQERAVSWSPYATRDGAGLVVRARF